MSELVSDKLRIPLRSVPLIGWLAFGCMITSIFYVIPSGNPQPSDWLTVLLIAGVFRAGGLKFTAPLQARDFLIWVAILVGNAVFINLCWTAYTGYFGIAKTALFFVYNSLVLLTMILLYVQLGRTMLVGLLHAVAVAVALQVFLGPLVMNSGLRQSLFFNNPNQLGYYNLLCACIVFALIQVVRVPKWYSNAILVGCTYLIFLSVSRATYGGIALLFLMMNLRRPAVLAVMTLAGGLILWTAGLAPDDFGYAGSRMGDLQSGSDRGYDRILEHPTYLIFGAGEGASHRYSTSLDSQELHSTLGMLLFSYGITGIGSFFGMLFALYRAAGLRIWLGILPPMFFGLTHQGLRMTTFWILLGTMLCAGIELRRQQRNTASNAQSRGRAKRAYHPV